MAATIDLDNKLNITKKGVAGYMFKNTKCSGVTYRLGKLFYSNFDPPVKKRRGKYGSSQQSGEVFHRRVFHEFTCLKPLILTTIPTTGLSCCCKGKLGTKTRVSRKDVTKTDLLLQSLNKFLTDKNWFVFASEMVVGTPEMYCATAADLVCVDNPLNPTKIFIVELKTGYRTHRDTARTTDKTGKMKGEFGSTIENSYKTQHQLQLCYTVIAFEQTYKIPVSDAVVVYLQAIKPFYKTEYAASWWFRNVSNREKFIKQLKG